MDGLEAVEIKFKSIDMRKRRLDSEFYKKEILLIIKLMQSKPHKTFGEIIDILTDYHANGSYEKLREHVELLEKNDYAHMVRTTDFVRDDFDENIVSISESAYNYLEKTQLFGDEILINKIGSYTGQSFLMPKPKKPSSLGMNIFMLRLKKGYSPKFYQTYLKTKFANLMIEQGISGASPKSIDKESVRNILIPVVSIMFQRKIESYIENAYKNLEQSKKIYFDAENVLLEELGLKDWKPSEKSVEVKSFKESFGVSGRLDAEYYQPKYDEIEEHIKKYEVKNLNEIVTIKKSIEPGTSAYSDEGIPFVRVSNLSKIELTEPDIKISPLLAIEELKPKKDTILLTKDGSVGIAYKVEQDLNVITSGAILHLNIFDISILPDYLTTVLNSLVVKLQAQRDAGGSIIQHWRIGDIEKIMIPILPMIFQEEISKKIKESFSLKEKSKQLLEIAKLGVEKAIEEDEETAIKWIESEVLKTEIMKGAI